MRMELEKAKEILKTFKFRQKTINYNEICLEDVEAIETVLKVLENSVSKDKLKNIILSNKDKIKSNIERITECRKTIMKEQTLKKLELYTLERENELLELEIKDLFEMVRSDTNE